MKIEYKEGDLFGNLPNTGTILIPHVVNSVGAFSAGFVVPLSKRFPEARESYHKWFKDGKYNDVSFLLGLTLFESVETDDEYQVIVAHMLAQKGLPSAKNRQPLQYDALEKCIGQVGYLAGNLPFTTIHCPLFGAGLGGADWYKIEMMVREYWIKQQNIPVTCYYLKDKLPKGWHPPQGN
jgi:hypothetical protein